LWRVSASSRIVFRAVTAIAAVCVTTSLAAQAPPRDPQKWVVPAGTASISGTVIDDDGKPVRRVSVVFEGDARTGRIAITDDQGRFAVSGMPAARYTIRAEKAGFPSMSYGAKRPGRAGSGLLVKDGAVIDGIVLRMTRGAVITGTLYDPSGRPLPNASVTAYAVETTITGEFSVRPIARSGSSFPVTDDLGMFRFYGLPPGEYIVGTSPIFPGFEDGAVIPTDAEIRAAFAMAEQRAEAAVTGQRSAASVPPAVPALYTSAYYGDVTDPSVSTRIRVSAGEERAGVDLHVVWQPTATISGEVQGPNPDLPPISMQLIGRRTLAGAATSRVTPNSTNVVFLYPGLAPGDYLVTARTRGGPVLWAESPVTVASTDVTAVRLVLQPAMNASGRIVFDGTALPPPDPAKLSVVPTPISRSGWAFTGPAKVNASYAFTIDDLVPGRLRIGALWRDTPKPGAPAWTLASVMLGDRDVTDLPFEIAAGDVIPPITITFTDHSSELGGVLLTPAGEPATDYFVVLLAADERYWFPNSRRIRSTRPDANGHYVFPGVPAGSYRVAATTDLEPQDLSSLTFLRELIATSAEVTVGVSEKKTFDLKLGGG
jgi:hypothetical protein